MRNLIYIALVGIVFMSACTEEFSFDFEGKETVLVVDAVLTDQDTIHYVQLTKSLDKLVPQNTSGSPKMNFEAIKDAVVRISDNLGNSEDLKYIGKPDHLWQDTDGWYELKTMRGVIGRSYTLHIEWNGQVYTAESTIKPVPEIEKIGFRTKRLESKNEDVTIPLLYFTEPQNTDDYYLLHYKVDGWGGSNRQWEYSIISDEYLTEQVNGMEIDDGQSGSGRDFYREIHTGNKVEVYMESLSKEAFDFYEGLINQFKADGGAFSQAPATPPGNISNGALGLFRTSAVSYKKVIKE